MNIFNLHVDLFVHGLGLSAYILELLFFCLSILHYLINLRNLGILFHIILAICWWSLITNNNRVILRPSWFTLWSNLDLKVILISFNNFSLHLTVRLISFICFSLNLRVRLFELFNLCNGWFCCRFDLWSIGSKLNFIILGRRFNIFLFILVTMNIERNYLVINLRLQSIWISKADNFNIAHNVRKL